MALDASWPIIAALISPVALVSPMLRIPAPIQLSTVSGRDCDSPKTMYTIGVITKAYIKSQSLKVKTA